MKNIIFFISIITFYICITYSQVQQEWIARYAPYGNNIDEAFSIKNDNFGNVYITGISSSSEIHYDYATIKYNNTGVQEWIQRFGYTSSAYGQALALDINRNVYVTGYFNAPGLGNTDIATIKYNNYGVSQYVSEFSGSSNGFDKAFYINCDKTGKVYVSGFTFNNSSDNDFLLIDANWTKYYNGTANGDDEVKGMAIDTLGNIYITGWSQGNVSGIGYTGYDIVTIKYSSSGVQQWVQRYNGSLNNNDRPSSIALDKFGNVYVTGSTTVTMPPSTDFIVIKYNSAGVQQWVQRYNHEGNRNDLASEIAVYSQNPGIGIYVTGISYNGSNFDIATIKYNDAGVQQWVRIYNGPGNRDENANCLELDSLENIYIAGSGVQTGNNKDYLVLKYDKSGNQVWTQWYNGPGNNTDEIMSMCIDNNMNIYVTGYSYGNGTSYDYCTIKYSQLIGIKVISNEVPDEFKLHQNYPNPFNPSTKIRFTIPSNVKSETSNVKLVVFDVLGREVATLVNEQLHPGTYEVEWPTCRSCGAGRDESNYSSGVYYYMLETGSFTDTKIMILIK